MANTCRRIRRRSLTALLAALALIGSSQLALAIHAPPEDPDAPAGNYDIRLDSKAGDRLAVFRADVGHAESEAALAQSRFAQGATRLRAQLPDVVIESGVGLATPELVARSVHNQGFLTGPGSGDREADLRDFMKTHAGIYGMDTGDIDALAVVADYVNPDGQLAWVHLEQRLHGRPVFQGEIKAGFAPDGAIIRTIGQLAPWPDVPAPRISIESAQEALQTAAGAIAVDLPRHATPVLESSADGHELLLARGPFAQDIAAETLYFPIEPGVTRLAWRFILWQPDLAWMVIVDAATGVELWRKCLTEHQSQTATYGVYTRETPVGGWPGPISNTAPEGPLLNRGVTIARVGNEPPNTFNNLGWITDGTNLTDGNNVEAGLDRASPDGVDPGGRVQGIPNRVFVFNYNPAPGNPAPGSEPLHPNYPPNLSNFQRGAVVNVFHWSNRFHDALYLRGFTEAARNFQHDNFGRGGVGGDRISAEVQDEAGSDNAVFSTGPDGVRGRMQLHVFSMPTPDRDPALENTIILHELAHGLTQRLIGNAAGMNTIESRGLGEGWSDFVALSLLQSASQPQTSNYPVAAYVREQPYYGIRRFPYAPVAHRGGPGFLDMHAPQTFADIDPDQIDLSDGVYPPNPNVIGGARAVHNLGEIWALALLEGRKRLIERLGYADGNTRMLQIVVDGMKLSPLNPTFLQARDAVLAAALALGDPADVDDLWRGFGARGMGLEADSDGSSVVESFLVRMVNQEPAIGFDDSQCNGNDRLDPGERILLEIPLTNLAVATATNTRLSIDGQPVYDYGTLAPGATVSRSLPFTVPTALVCGAPLPLELGIGSSLGQQTEHRRLITGQALPGWLQRFETVVPPALPAGWTSTVTGSHSAWVTSNTSPYNGNHAAFAAGAIATGSTSLNAASFIAAGGPARISYWHQFNLENLYDGVVLEVDVGLTGSWQDIESIGGYFEHGGYNRTLDSSNACSANPNPLAGRRAWSGNSGGYRQVSAALPAMSPGTNVRLRWRLGSDCSIASPVGIHIDDVQIIAGYSCAKPVCQDLIFRNGLQGIE